MTGVVRARISGLIGGSRVFLLGRRIKLRDGDGDGGRE